MARFKITLVMEMPDIENVMSYRRPFIGLVTGCVLVYMTIYTVFYNGPHVFGSSSPGPQLAKDKVTDSPRANQLDNNLLLKYQIRKKLLQAVNLVRTDDDDDKKPEESDEFYLPRDDGNKKSVYFYLSDFNQPDYLPTYKNPCWEHGNKLRCLPYVFLAGFPKCGTTDLHYRLLAHPLMTAPRRKEPHFFSRVIYAKMSRSTYCRAGKEKKFFSTCPLRGYADAYLSEASRDMENNSKTRRKGSKIYDKAIDLENNFAVEWRKMRKEAAQTIPHPMITLESSASTAWDNSQWRAIGDNQGLTQPKVLTPDLLYKINPKVRIIMILRDPVQRAYSDYMYFHHKASSKEEFHKLVVSFINKFNTCQKKHSLFHCASTVRRNQPKAVRLDIGIYHLHISYWLERIPRDQLLFLTTEEYHKDMAAQLTRIHDFLGLTRLSQDALQHIADTRQLNENKRKNSEGPMLPETQAILTQFYSEHNKALAKLLNDDKFAWNS